MCDEYDKNSSLDVETIINNTDCHQKKKKKQYSKDKKLST